MSDAFDRVIIGDLVGTDRVLRDGYVAVRGESIAAIGQGVPPPATETLDHRGRLILPGLVDGHMHTSSAIGWPGIEGATRSAADDLYAPATLGGRAVGATVFREVRH